MLTTSRDQQSMQRLAIFVSSTCFDLKALREHLRAEITRWGHEPILSEYPSFPVAPDLSTIENCKKVVRDRADILVLIVGGRRGSIDPATSRSIVNSEYREARAKGIDCIVFAEKTVWDFASIYAKNPDADFSPAVDSSSVFEFLKEVREDTRWVFPFSSMEELLTGLKTQLSVRLQDLLCRSREGRLLAPRGFEYESASTTRIAQDKDRFWEHRLAYALLQDRVERFSSRIDDLNSGFAFRRTRFVRPRDTQRFLQDLLSDITQIVMSIDAILARQLNEAFGAPGVPGNPVAIKAACDNLYALFLALYEWEMDVRFVRVHAAFEGLFPIMQGWSGELITEFRLMLQQLDRLLNEPQLTGHHIVKLTMSAPKSLPALLEKLNQIGSDPRVIAALRDD